MNQNIIVAVDHSEQSENAVKYYLERLHRHGNKLILVHSIELPELSLHNARECHVSPAVLASMWREEETKCKNLEDKMKALLKGRGVSARLRSCPGKAGEVVCRIGVEENAAYIVMGTRGGSSGLKRTVLGSVGDHIVRHAPCPVLICRDPEDVERQRRRHLSAGAGESAASAARRQSEGGDKVRHKSGDAFTSFASNLRRRFSSGGSGAAKPSRMARSVDYTAAAEGSELALFDTSTVLYPGSVLHDTHKEQHEMIAVASEDIHMATIEQ